MSTVENTCPTFAPDLTHNNRPRTHAKRTTTTPTFASTLTKQTKRQVRSPRGSPSLTLNQTKQKAELAKFGEEFRICYSPKQLRELQKKALHQNHSDDWVGKRNTKSTDVIASNMKHALTRCVNPSTQTITEAPTTIPNHRRGERKRSASISNSNSTTNPTTTNLNQSCFNAGATTTTIHTTTTPPPTRSPLPSLAPIPPLLKPVSTTASTPTVSTSTPTVSTSTSLSQSNTPLLSRKTIELPCVPPPPTTTLPSTSSTAEEFHPASTVRSATSPLALVECHSLPDPDPHSLSLEQTARLMNVLLTPKLLCPNNASISVVPKEFLSTLVTTLNTNGVVVSRVRLEGSGASHVVNSNIFPSFNDLDITIELESKDDDTLRGVRQLVFDTLRTFGPSKTTEEGVAWERAICCGVVGDPDGPLRKMWITPPRFGDKDQDAWAIFTLGNSPHDGVDLKFVQRIKRSFQFSVDSFRLDISTIVINTNTNDADDNNHHDNDNTTDSKLRIDADADVKCKHFGYPSTCQYGSCPDVQLLKVKSSSSSSSSESSTSPTSPTSPTSSPAATTTPTPTPPTTTPPPCIPLESVYCDIDCALEDLHNGWISVEDENELASIRGGGLLKYASYLSRGLVPRETVDVPRLEKYAVTRFLMDFPAYEVNRYGQPVQRQTLIDYCTSHFPPTVEAPYKRQVFMRQLHAIVQAVSHDVNFADALLDTIIYVMGCFNMSMMSMSMMHQQHIRYPMHQQQQHQPQQPQHQQHFVDVDGKYYVYAQPNMMLPHHHQQHQQRPQPQQHSPYSQHRTAHLPLALPNQRETSSTATMTMPMAMTRTRTRTKANTKQQGHHHQQQQQQQLLLLLQHHSHHAGGVETDPDTDPETDVDGLTVGGDAHTQRFTSAKAQHAETEMETDDDDHEEEDSESESVHSEDSGVDSCSGSLHSPKPIRVVVDTATLKPPSSYNTILTLYQSPKPKQTPTPTPSVPSPSVSSPTTSPKKSRTVATHSTTTTTIPSTSMSTSTSTSSTRSSPRVCRKKHHKKNRQRPVPATTKHMSSR